MNKIKIPVEFSPTSVDIDLRDIIEELAQREDQSDQEVRRYITEYVADSLADREFPVFRARIEDAFKLVKKALDEAAE